jgi:probable F420-dependent oxidoreductase
MQFGAVFPTCEIGDDPIAVRDFAQAAEALGYEHIVIYDHVLGAEHANRAPPLRGPYDETHPFHEPFVLLAYLAGITHEIDLMTGVLILPQRQTVLVAKQAAELSLLSNGRFRLGVGTGWNHVEYTGLGTDFASRGRRFDEQVTLLRKLWTEPLVTFRGEFHDIERANIAPRPRARLPLWFGGAAAPAIRRAAATGDGFVFGAAGDYMKGLCGQLTAALDANGRRAGFGIDALIGFGEGPDAWRREVAAWQALGADTLSVRTMTASTAFVGEKDPGFTRPQQHIDALSTFMRAVRESADAGLNRSETRA